MNNRIVSLDAFRGLMLLSMTFNHLVLFPFIRLDACHEMIKYYVYSSFGYLSNSEGFFFLAGVVSGIVYGKLKTEELWPRVKKRIVQMYAVHIALLFGFALLLSISKGYVAEWKELHSLIWVWKGQPGIHYFLDNPWSGFLLGSLFLYFPPFFDILPLYMLFLAAIPFVIGKLNQGRALMVLATTTVFWLISQYLPQDMFETPLKTYLPVKLGWFHPLAIQLLFFVGMTLGFYYKKGTLIATSQLFLYTGIFLAVMCLLLTATAVDLSSPNHLGFQRLACFALKAGVAYLLASSFQMQFLVRVLARLGSQSLPVFSFHMVLVYSLVFFLSDISRCSTQIQLIYLLLSLGSLWIPAYFKPQALGWARSPPCCQR